MWLTFLYVRSSLRTRSRSDFLLAFYFTAQTFALGYYIIANVETWFFYTAYLQMFGLLVWIPMALAEGYLIAFKLSKGSQGFKD